MTQDNKSIKTPISALPRTLPHLIEQEPKYLPTYNTPEINKVWKLDYNNAQIDQYTDIATVSIDNIEAVFTEFTVTGKLSLSTKKLLWYIIHEFTKANNKDSAKHDKIEYNIAFRIDQYMITCNRQVTSANLKKFKREVRNDLQKLYNASLSTKVNKNNKDSDFIDMRFIYAKGIDRGYIKVSISPELAIHLLNKPRIMPFAKAILAIPNDDCIAGELAFKLNSHAGMDNNIKRGTYNRIKVSTLLESAPSIPSYEEVINSTNRSYNKRIIIPFEGALDRLKDQYGVLEHWQYCMTNGRLLTDKELEKINDYHNWKALLVEFELKDMPDRKAELEAKRKTRRKPRAKKQEPTQQSS